MAYLPRLGATLPARLPFSVGERQERPTLSPQAIFQVPLSDTQPLAADQRLAANLAAIASWRPTTSPVHVYYGTPYWTTSDGGPYAVPVWVVPEGTPRVKVWSNRNKLNLQAVLDGGVPLPDPALIPKGKIGAAGTDGSCVIISGNKLWEFWIFAAAAAGSVAASKGYAWQCEQGGYIDDLTAYSAGFYRGGFYSGTSGWGVAACGATMLGGRLMAEDYWRGTIDHALVAALPLTGSLSGVYPPPAQWPEKLAPATRNDACNFTGTPDAVALPYRVPEGAWFRLPPGFDTVAWAAAHHSYASEAVVEMVCRALRDYGLMVNDSAGVIGFGCEGSSSFGTPYNPWAKADVPVWGSFGVDLPWAQLQQIAARTA